MSPLRILSSALLLLVAVAPANAQQVNPLITIAPSTPSLSLGPGNESNIDWTIRNGGPLEGSVTLTLTPPAGWMSALAAGDRTFTLAAGATRTVRTPVTLPAGANVTNGTLTLAGIIQDTNGQRSASDSKDVRLVFIRPVIPAPVPPPPPDHTAAIAASISGGIGALLLSYLFLGTRVGLRPDADTIRVNRGTTGLFRLEVRNRALARRNVHLKVDRLPAGWSAAFSYPQILLGPRERAMVPLHVSVPSDAKLDARVPVRALARAFGYFPWLVRRTVYVSVVDVSAPEPKTIPPGPAAAKSAPRKRRTSKS